jgi:hypothetical protein
MRRWLLACSATVGLALSSGMATAGDFQDKWHSYWHDVHTDFYRNNTWPEPFNSADRARVREPFCIQTDNGWKMQNTVGTYLYEPDTQQLNRAGELLVKWIVTQAPHHRRAVFVLKGDTPEATAARVESVQMAVARFANGPVCPVLITDSEPSGWSASYIDTMTQQFNSTIPAPRLPAGGDAGGGGGGSGGGGGGGSGGSN